MDLGVVDTHGWVSKQLFEGENPKSSTNLMNHIQVINENVLPKVNALLICKNQSFGIKEICEWIITVQKKNPVPIWIATIEHQMDEKNVYLQLGACGIFEESHSVEEMLLTISNNLRIAKADKHRDVKENHYFKLDLLELSLSLDGVHIALTETEYILMEYLYDHQNKVCTYEELAKILLRNYEKFTESSYRYRVANIIFRVRTKFANIFGSDQNLIRTVRSRGYMLSLLPIHSQYE